MIDEKAIEVMREIMEAFGQSGFEREVNYLITKYMKEYADEVIYDKLGYVAFIIKGKDTKVLLAGHTDEVGFIISSITDGGYLTFNQLGGWWDQTLLSQRIIVRGKKGDVHGVIASKPPHILSQEERKSA